MTVANLTILDTGYANLARTGTQEIMANSGIAFQLNGANIRYRRQTGHSDDEVPGKYSNTDVNFASISNPIITIKGVLNRAIANDVANALVLDNLCTTKGLKALYYSSVTDGYQSIVSAFGATSHTDNLGTTTSTILGITPTIKWLVVRCLEFDIEQSSDGKVLPYTLTCEVTVG